MNRKKFVELVGLGSVSIAIAVCFAACKKDLPTVNTPTTSPTTPVTSAVPTPSNTTLLTLDLNDLANTPLKTVGGYVYNNDHLVIVARAASGSYIAVSQVCTHQGTTIHYITSPSEFHCPLHGSNFTESGVVINGPAASSLTQYKTSLSGNTLPIKSS